MIRHGIEAGTKIEDEKQLKEFKIVDEMDETAEKHYKMVVLNPDDYKSWNWLKRQILEMKERAEIKEEAAKQLFATQQAIEVNPKSYYAWYHRGWLINRYGTDMNREYRLCMLLLSLDSRNFHCWNHTRLIGLSIPLDFDNYSSTYCQCNNSVAAFYCDPHDEGIWRLMGRTRYQNSTGPCHVNIYSNNMLEIHFYTPFIGKACIYDELLAEISVEIPKYTLISRVKYNLTIKLKGALKLKLYSDKNKEEIYELKEEEQIINIDELEAIDESVFIYFEKLKITEELVERERVIEKLVALDPIREKYYKSLVNKYYKTYTTFRPWLSN